MQGKADNAPNVAVLVDTSSGWGRRMIEGVAGYALKHGPWHLRVEQRGRTEHLSLPPNWPGDGVIARISTQRMCDAMRKLRIPVVNVSAIDLDRCNFPRVTSNNQSAATIMADHFLERGFEHYAYVGSFQHAYVRQHLEAVREALIKAGVTNEVATFNYRVQSVTNRGWAVQNRKLTDWLADQPRPLAVIGWATTAAAHVLDACRNADLAVPDDVAVLSSDEDTLINECTVPPMSGLVVASGQIGYRAAEVLDDLMHGQRPEQPAEKIDPIEIITRGSTETFAIEDRNLLQAVSFMRHNAYRPLSIDEIADAVPMTRRTLERKFKETFGRTPLAEINRLRLARAKQLLAHTDHSTAQIAESCGFETAGYLSTWFRKQVGVTPLKYRSATRAR